MSWFSKKFIRGAYVTSQAVSAFCMFAGPLLTYMSGEHDAETAEITDYAVSFGIAAVAAGLIGFTANFFQGKRIDPETEDEQESKEVSKESDHTNKSHLCKSRFA